MESGNEDDAAVRVKVVAARQGDMLRVAPLIAEMLTFYGAEGPPIPLPDFAVRLEKDGPAGRREYDCLIADDAQTGTALGFAMYSTVYEAAFPGNGIFLRDIYVTKSARERGVGKALMVALAQVCLREGYRRIDWHADRLDLHARTFYELMAPDSFKLNRLSYRIEEEEIELLSKR
ncbi:GNAT family N-acetyltransferase [Rhodospirillaceae bacterium KN72]|uniref:GNAT family N-acetyltransferase n=1 Tax=Pacificispira spongiicola TaxID=2729598 RepID=A0A7Y0DWM9_9PROT|nr:GNAT family N-acetyltransferase [Pacificispira spongiicola]NMM42974.1 GNAT family N-acetyltransferase [Pacificispira spongiicola]